MKVKSHLVTRTYLFLNINKLMGFSILHSEKHIILPSLIGFTHHFIVEGKTVGPHLSFSFVFVKNIFFLVFLA